MIIGITGLPCSGSDTTGNILTGKGFTWMSYSDLLRAELRKEGGEVTREAMQELANNWRAAHGPGALSEKLLSAMEPGKNYIVGTLRNPGEIEVFRKKLGDHFFLVAISASREIRFDRMVARARDNDPTTFESFVALEEKELGHGQEQHGLQIKACIDQADHTVPNEGSVTELEEHVERLLETLAQKQVGARV